VAPVDPAARPPGGSGGRGGDPPPPLPPLPAVWRPRRGRAVAATAALVVAAGGCLLAALVPGPWHLGDRLAIVALALVVSAVLLLLARPVLRADDRGLTVVNLLTGRRLDWSEVLRVGLGRDDSWAALDLADGTSYPVMALQASDGERTRRAVAEVAALVAARGEAPECPGRP